MRRIANIKKTYSYRLKKPSSESPIELNNENYKLINNISIIPGKISLLLEENVATWRNYAYDKADIG